MVVLFADLPATPVEERSGKRTLMDDFESSAREKVRVSGNTLFKVCMK